MVINKKVHDNYTILEVWSNGCRSEIAVQHLDLKIKGCSELAINLVDEMEKSKPKIARSMSKDIIKLCSILMQLKYEVIK